MHHSLSQVLRPAWPEPDAARAELQENMSLVLSDEWEPLLAKWLERTIGADRARTWGPVDISVNTLGALCSQLSTPGHYQHRPEIRHADARAAALIAPDVGLLDQALWGPIMQQVEYRTLGVGDHFLRPHISDTGRLSLIDVPAQFVRKDTDSNDRRRLTLIEWLRPRVITVGADAYEVWTIEVYDIRDPANPRHYVTLAGGGPGTMAIGEDLSGALLGTAANPSGNWNGEAYPFVGDTGPFIPFGWWSSQASGKLWQVTAGRGAYHGALQTGLLQTYAMQAARDSAGTTVVLVDIEAPAGSLSASGAPGQERSIALKPGSMMFLRSAEDGKGQPMIQSIGPGMNLEKLAAFAADYEARLMSRMGLSPSDITRATGNQSAQALLVTDSGRRRYSSRIRPLLRASDLQFVEIIASLARMAGIDVPASGYTITYYDIPDSPEEERARRESEQADLDRGLISRVDLWRTRHPGATAQDAVQALAQARADEIAVDSALKDLLPTDDNLVPTDLDPKRAELVQAVVMAAHKGETSTPGARAVLIAAHGIAPHVADAMLTPSPVPVPVPDSTGGAS